ncbi:MAG: ABC transporter ATP-binding protein [Gammaproteobacteria bacterium]|nr:ABC transporter ATP-binding protein [Gammaproteobacteria bacterium]
MRRLELTNVSHRFGETLAVDDVSIGVETGEFVCLLGPSGSGKTTLLRLAAGLETLQSGRITIDGTTVAEGGHARQIPPERRGVGLMFQDYALFPHLTVAQNIGFGLHDGTRDSGWIERALADMRLAHLGDRYPHTLSGGQQQRIALLRALAPVPGILLLDEPFSGLDEHLRQRVRQETRAILAESGVTTLMVTHNPEAAMFLADRIVVLNDGRVAQDATPVEIYTAPADPFIVRMFGPANEFGGVVRGGVLATALGPVPASGVGNGKRALCLVRADGVEVTADPPGGGSGYVRVRVETARVLGATSYLLLEPTAGAISGRAPSTIEARLPGVHVPATGREVWARAREEETFVFALD